MKTTMQNLVGPDIVVLEKQEKEVVATDVAIQCDSNIRMNKRLKLEKYQVLQKLQKM